MKEVEKDCICRFCAFADACPSAYFPINKKICADLRDMRNSKSKMPNRKRLRGRGNKNDDRKACGRLSKCYYTIDTMISAAKDYQQRLCDESEYYIAYEERNRE